MRAKTFVWMGAVILLVLIAAIPLGWICFRAYGNSKLADFRVGLHGERFKDIHVGMTEAEVESILGEPPEVVDRSNVSMYASMPGMKKHGLTEKALLYYVYGEFLLLVYLDRSDKVERACLAGMGWQLCR